MRDKNRSPCRLLESAPPSTPANLREGLELSPQSLRFYEEQREGKAVPMVRLNIAEVDIINRNRRYYSRAVYEAANERAKADMESGRLWGLLEHPDWIDGAKGRLERIALKFEELGIEGNTVYAKARVVETEAGQTFRALNEAGVRVGVSTNGYSRAGTWEKARGLDPNWADPDELIYVVATDFTYLTIDLVGDPSNPGGEVPTESTKEHTVNPKLKKVLERLGMTEAEFKSRHADWHAELIAEDAAPPASTPQPSTPTSGAEGTLERTVLALNARLEASEKAQLEERRRNIAVSALEAASLPKAPKVGDLDLDARFREQLEGAALAAADDATAKVQVDAMIAERRALLGLGKAPADRTRSSGVSLPIGNVEGLAGKPSTPNGAEVRNIRNGFGL